MDEKNLWTIISTIVITALIVGGTVYFVRKSVVNSLQNDINELRSLVIQSQNTQDVQKRITDLEDQIIDLKNTNEVATDSPVLTNSIVLSLLKNDLIQYSENSSDICLSEGVQGSYDSCNINITKNGNQWDVIITYDKLADDSIQATRVKSIITYVNEDWVKSSISKDQKCWPNRGHQDFSTEVCI